MRRIFVSCAGIAVAMLAAHPICSSPLAAQAPADSTSAARSSQTLTLAEAQARARRVSPQLTVAREALAAATGLARQARPISNPTFSFQREQTSGSGQENSQNITSIDQPLDIAVRNARAAAAAQRRDGAEARLHDAESQVDLDVARAYALVIAAERRAELAREARESFARARRIADERFAAGDISGYAHRRIRLEAARYTALGVEATLALDHAHRTLATLISAGTPATDARTTTEKLATPTATATLSLTADSLVALALANRGDLRAARADEAAAASEERVASRSRIPVPVLTAGIKTEDISGVGELRGFAAGVVFPLPLWDRRTGAVEAASAGARSATAQTELVRRRVVQDVQQAFTAMQAIRAQLNALTPELGVVAAAALRSANVAYTEGEITLLEWLDAVRAYQEAESAFASLQAESLIRDAALQRAVGLSTQVLVP